MISADEFAARFREAWKTLWAIALGLVRSPVTAEDVVQESAVIALRKLDAFQEGTSFVAWMAQIVRFTALNRLRRREPASVDPSDLQPVGREPAAEAVLDARGQLAAGDAGHFDDRVTAALAALGETARACLLLRTVGELEYREIARLLDLPEGTAMSHVHRARASLRRALAGQELER